MLLFVGIQIPDYFRSAPVRLKITGNEVLTRDTVIKYLNIKKDESWFSLDPFLLSLNLKKHSWIDQVMVHRRLPQGIEVRITEKRPVAYLKTRNDLFLLGRDNLALKSLPGVKVWDLPVIVNRKLKDVKPGDVLPRSMFEKTYQLIDLLRKSEVLPLNAVSEIIVSDPLNIQLITIPDGIKIKFGFRNFADKLAALEYAMPKLEQNRKEIQYIDLRSLSGVVIKKKS